MAINTILATNNNIMVVTNSEPIIQRSKNAHRVKIYIPEKYIDDELDTKDATVSLELLAPNGKRITSLLEPEEDSVKVGYLMYLYDIDSAYTTASGDIELGMTVTYVSLDTGRTVIRTFDGCVLPITPISEWMNQASDDSLTDIQNKITQLTKIAEAIYNAEGGGEGTGASDLEVKDKNLHLINALGKKIGEGIEVTDDSIDRLDLLSDGELDLGKLV